MAYRDKLSLFPAKLRAFAEKALALLLFIASSNSYAGLYAGTETQEISFDEINVRLSGVAGAFYGGKEYTYYLEISSLEDEAKDIEYEGIEIGIDGSFNQAGAFDLGLGIGVGIGRLDVPWYSNENLLLSIPVDATASYRIFKGLSIYTGVGYRYFFDLTENTRCKDGTTSSSTGSGTCSWHDGVAFSQDEIGNGGGTNYRIGLRFTFQ